MQKCLSRLRVPFWTAGCRDEKQKPLDAAVSGLENTRESNRCKRFKSREWACEAEQYQSQRVSRMRDPAKPSHYLDHLRFNFPTQRQALYILFLNLPCLFQRTRLDRSGENCIMLLLPSWSLSVADVHALAQHTTKPKESPEDNRSSCGESKSFVSFTVYISLYETFVLRCDFVVS